MIRVERRDSEVLTTPSQGRKHKGSILVLDDEPATLKPLFTILTEGGYAVSERHLDLESQLRFVKDTLPDLVLVDVRTRMDGYQLCASLKNDPSTRAVPVIFISSIGRSINQAKALLSGAVDYVTDPFDAQEVLWRIETHISLRRLREYLESATRHHVAQPVAPNADLEKAFQEIRVLTQVTGRKHAEERVRQAARELKQAQEALHSSERNLILTIDTIPTFITVSRADGTVLSVNKAALDYHGITLQDVQRGEHRTRFFHPDDVDRVRELRQEGLKHPRPFEYEQRAMGKDGKYRWFSVRHSPLLDDQGRIDRWYAIAFDIEDRKRAEAQLELAYLRLAEAQRMTKTGSFITDLVADEHNWSEELCRIFEFDPGTQVTTDAIRAAFHPEDLPVYEDAFKRAVEGHRDIDLTYRIITPGGKVKHLHAVADVLEKVAGRPVYIGAIQDVTERKVAEDALNRARSELAHMARVTTLSALTASIAHEINQPIAAAITSAGACLRWLNRDQPEVQRAREAVMRIEEDAKRAAAIITHLKSFYKKDFSPEREVVSINDLVDEMVVLLRSEADRHSVAMHTELTTDLPSVRADRVQLQQVLMNLMLNGVEAMTERGGELTIRTGRERGEVVVSVSDTGVGIPADKLEDIFNAFVTTKAGGTGMGLAISRTIIESHGGQLWAAPSPEHGATFHFSLPIEAGA